MRPRLLRPTASVLAALALLLGTGCGSDDVASSDPAATSAPGAAPEGDDLPQPTAAPGADVGDPPDDGEPPDAVAGDAVAMSGTEFVPHALAVAVGTEVTWTNEDPVGHTTTADEGAWDSGTLDEGGTFAHTFDEAGTFSYSCQIHPSMSGQIVVE